MPSFPWGESTVYLFLPDAVLLGLVLGAVLVWIAMLFKGGD